MIRATRGLCLCLFCSRLGAPTSASDDSHRVCVGSTSRFCQPHARRIALAPRSALLIPRIVADRTLGCPCPARPPRSTSALAAAVDRAQPRRCDGRPNHRQPCRLHQRARLADRGSDVSVDSARWSSSDALDPVDAPLFRDAGTGWCYPYNGRGEPIRFANYGEAVLMHRR